MIRPFMLLLVLAAFGVADSALAQCNCETPPCSATEHMGLSAFDDANTTDLLETLFPVGAARLLSVGLDDAAFDAAAATGRDRGYIVGLDRHPVDPCRQLRALVAHAGWLVRAGEMQRDAVVPLVDTRTRAVLRRGRAGLTLDGDGVVILAGVRGPRP